DPAQLKTPYERSKWEAERLARELAAGRLSLVVVYPTMPLGPEDRKPTPSGRMVIDFLYGRLPFYVNMYLNVAAVEDVAAGHVAALERGRDGEGYILGNRNLTLKDLLDMLARLTGDPAPRGQVPLALARLTALVEENILYRLSGRPPRVSQASVRVAGRRLWCNCQKAINELGLPQTPIEEALARSISWFKSHGYV
ncbi:MAG: dihydroflavonol 4-reductase, partial [Thermoleophilia bacterium]|nr:dihydroflavonol 4-reductase [Thermoleophilia bacterium]